MIANVSNAGTRQARGLAVEHETLDVRVRVGVGLEAIAARDPRELEPTALRFVLGRKLRAQLFDRLDRHFEQLRHHRGVHGLGRGQHDRLDRAPRLDVDGHVRVGVAHTCSCTRSTSYSLSSTSIVDARTRRQRLVAPLFERGEVERHAFAGRERAHHEVAEALDLLEIDDALLEQLEHREEPHDDFELLGARRR